MEWLRTDLPIYDESYDDPTGYNPAWFFYVGENPLLFAKIEEWETGRYTLNINSKYIDVFYDLDLAKQRAVENLKEYIPILAEMINKLS